MIFPFSMKIGPIAVEMEPHPMPKSDVDFDYAKKCWNELKPLVDNVLEVELDKLKLNRFQNAKTKLAVEIINALGKRPIEEKRFKEELIKTGKFSKEEAEVFLKEAISQGMIFEGGDGYYARN